jgi:tetratricopeptide (TPR) repeat protein
MAEKQGNDPEVRFDVALASAEAGEIQETLGQTEEALQNRHKARAALAALTAEFPQRIRYRFTFVLVLVALGGRSYLCPTAEPGSYLHQALEQTNELTRVEPRNVEYRSVRATVHHQLGIWNQMQQHDTEAAETHYRQAVAQLEELSAEQPEVREHRQLLANSLVNLSLLVQNKGGSSKELHDRAEATLEQLRGEEPDDNEVLNSLATLRIIWAPVLAKEGKPEAALADLAESVALLEEALRREPKHVRFRELLHNTHGVRAQVYETRQRFAEAAKEYQRVVELSPSPEKADFHRLILAINLARAGQHALADKEIEEWKTRVTPATPAEHLVHCLGVYYIALNKVRADSQLPTTERETLVERYGSHAVALLRILQERDFFKDPEKARELKTDEELRPLRDREDFRNLLRDIERGKHD